MNELRPYQTAAINSIAKKYASGIKSICFQLATGGGKTVAFAGLVNRYLARNDRKVLILVHRDELQKQARKTLWEWYGIVACPVIAGVKKLPQDASVYVAMVETANNRLRKSPSFFGDVGLVIIDECHLGNFKKLYEHFPDALKIGCTATPIAASKKHPLKNDFQDIVCGIDIPELIAQKALVPNQTYHIKNVNRQELSISKGEFDEVSMGQTFSKAKQVANVVKGYRDHAEGKKTLVFNCNIEHSKIVTQAFLDAGYNCKHLDGTSEDRAEIISWFKSTQSAILCNCAVLTTGFDDPSVECVAVNRATMSLPLWLQMCGRGSRPHTSKTHFTILDLGGNGLHHGDWHHARNWAEIFHNPEKASDKAGVAPMKLCDQCEAILHASVNVCPYCGHVMKKPIKIDERLAEFELLTRNNPFIVEPSKLKKEDGRSDYAEINELIRKLIFQAKYKWAVKTLTEPVANELRNTFQKHVEQWCNERQKRFNEFHQTIPLGWFNNELKKKFKHEYSNNDFAIQQH